MTARLDAAIVDAPVYCEVFPRAPGGPSIKRTVAI